VYGHMARMGMAPARTAAGMQEPTGIENGGSTHARMVAALMPASTPMEWEIANCWSAVLLAQEVHQDLKAKVGKVSQHLHIGGGGGWSFGGHSKKRDGGGSRSRRAWLIHPCLSSQAVGFIPITNRHLPYLYERGSK
jgi:hypothetical protein